MGEGVAWEGAQAGAGHGRVLACLPEQQGPTLLPVGACASAPSTRRFLTCTPTLPPHPHAQPHPLGCHRRRRPLPPGLCAVRPLRHAGRASHAARVGVHQRRQDAAQAGPLAARGAGLAVRLHAGVGGPVVAAPSPGKRQFLRPVHSPVVGALAPVVLALSSAFT